MGGPLRGLARAADLAGDGEARRGLRQGARRYLTALRNGKGEVDSDDSLGLQPAHTKVRENGRRKSGYVIPDTLASMVYLLDFV